VKWSDGLSLCNITAPQRGRFELLGRRDAIVKIAGKRVSLSRIEKHIRACPGVEEAAVIAVPAKGRLRDLAIWAAVVPNGRQALSAQALRSDLRNRLDGIEIPRRVLMVDHLPRTSSGKLPLAAIADLFEEHDQRRVPV